MPVPGSSLRLDNADLTRSLLTLIRRELPFQRQAGGAAIPPRWVPVRTAQGVLRALVFPINRKSAAYIGGLTEKAVVASLATSAGEAGSMAEYLRSTVQHLDDMGIWRTWASGEHGHPRPLSVADAGTGRGADCGRLTGGGGPVASLGGAAPKPPGYLGTDENPRIHFGSNIPAGGSFETLPSNARHRILRQNREASMKILILGAAGMIGRKLAAAYAGHDLILADVVAPAPQPGAHCLTVNLADPATTALLVADRPDLIFHLAAVVSGEAEADFDKGYAVNLDASRALLEAIRAQACRPRLVFASSCAVFGRPFPNRIPDGFHTAPLTSYGTQKAMTELLINDYSRRGFIDGVSLRLPTICIRPGTPNRAASGFFSNILREPLAGLPANLPVPEETRHWFASPRAATGFFQHAAALDLGPLGADRALNMPGLSATVGEQLAALARVAGKGALDLITRNPDPVVAKIVSGWAMDFDAARATALGFTAETSFDAIIRAHLDDAA